MTEVYEIFLVSNLTCWCKVLRYIETDDTIIQQTLVAKILTSLIFFGFKTLRHNWKKLKLIYWKNIQKIQKNLQGVKKFVYVFTCFGYHVSAAFGLLFRSQSTFSKTSYFEKDFPDSFFVKYYIIGICYLYFEYKLTC